MKKMGNLFKSARLELGFTQDYICNEINISTGHYSNIERDLKIPSIDLFFKICKILKINLAIFEDYEYSDFPLNNEIFKQLSESDTEFINEVAVTMAKGLIKRNREYKIKNPPI